MEISNNIIEKLESINLNTNITNDNKTVKNKDCIELKNLEYKNVLMYGNNLKPKDNNINVSLLEDLLEKESQLNRLDMWTKLDKTDKIIKLNLYTKLLVKKYDLTSEEEKQLSSYLIYALERKYISKIKDVIYSRENGTIVSIPNLIFNEETRRFYIKKNEKHVNTIKSLAPKKNKTHKF